MFIHDGHFLRDPCLLIDLLKPLLHHSIMGLKSGFRKEFLVNATDSSCEEFLELLQKDAVLDHRLLPRLKAWSLSSSEAQLSMMKFFQDTFMISAVEARDSGDCGGGRDAQRSLVTARLFDPSDVDLQAKVDALADSVAESAVFHAVYVLPSAHIGIIAHVMATVLALQPKKIGLECCCGENHVCMQRAAGCCAVSVRPLAHVFASAAYRTSFQATISRTRLWCRATTTACLHSPRAVWIP